MYSAFGVYAGMCSNVYMVVYAFECNAVEFVNTLNKSLICCEASLFHSLPEIFCVFGNLLVFIN